MLTLLQTLADIMLFRRGPEAIPRSSVVFAIVVVLWLVVDIAGVLLTAESGIRNLQLTLMVGIPGILVYVAFVQLNGKSDRVLQMLSAVIGCSALFNIPLSFLLATAKYSPNEGGIPLLTALVILVIYLWSINVDGHILAKSLNFPHAFGTAIALSVFVFQFYFGSLLFAGTPTTS